MYSWVIQSADVLYLCWCEHALWHQSRCSFARLSSGLSGNAPHPSPPEYIESAANISISFHHQRAVLSVFGSMCTRIRQNEMLYLEVVVLVNGASCVCGHVSHGCHVHVLAGKYEEIHAAALCHTVLRQLLIHTFLRLKQGLRKTDNK